MLMIISPAKSMDFATKPMSQEYTVPGAISYSKRIIDEIKNFTPQEISKLMKVSQDIASLTNKRFQLWSAEHNLKNSKQAIYAYTGDVYQGLNVNSFKTKELIFAQNHLAIVSGLYGLLRPLDLIQPYRLEMGVKFKIGNCKNLYEFWKNSITDSVNKYLEEQNSMILINLASNEYFKSIDKKKLKANVITPVFKDLKNDTYKVIGFFAKKARGMFANYIIHNKIDDKNISALKEIDLNGYVYNHEMSSEKEWVYTRESKQ